MSGISSNDYFDLGSWQTWNFMNWSNDTINEAGLNTYLDSYAQQMKQNGLKQVTLSFAQVCDIAKMLSGNFQDCSKDSSLEMIAVNTDSKTVGGKSVIAYVAQRLHADGLNVFLSFGGAAAQPSDWDFGFSGANTPQDLAKNLANWASSCGLSGIDFDIETGAEKMVATNGADNLASFFYSLHQDAEQNGMPISLTVMGDSGAWGPEGSYLGAIFAQHYKFNQMFDGVNLMLYNGQYYLNAGQTPAQSWDLTSWISQLEKTTGMSAADCAALLHIGFDGALDYSNAATSAGPLPYDPNEVPSSVKTSGEYGAYILLQLQNELRTIYNDPTLTLGSSFFWDDNANYTVNQNNYESQFFSNNSFEHDFFDYLQI